MRRGEEPIMQEMGAALIAADPWLAPYADALRDRAAHYAWRKADVDAQGGLLGAVSQSHHVFGLHRGELYGQPGVWYREWAPGADYLALFGDFNGWDRGANPLTREAEGVWSLFLGDREYGHRLTHASRLKVHIASHSEGRDRLPAYIRRVVQDAHSHDFTAQYWQPPQPYVWRHAAPHTDAAPRIYEAHVGMALEDGRVGTFGEFTRAMLPRIAALGYNAVQLMAVMEHPFYGSFGYHVSNFYAVSSRFGTPEELKELVDTAHGLGLRVIMDLVHSHVVKNVDEGLEPLRRHALPVFSRRAARLSQSLGQPAFRLRQMGGAAVSVVQCALLAGRVPFRRLPLRRRDQYAVPRPRHRAGLRGLRRLFRPQH